MCGEDSHNTAGAGSQARMKTGTLLWPVRIAAAGMTVTPGGAIEILAILGKERVPRSVALGIGKAKRMIMDRSDCT